jgi:hypothetical protein
MSTKNSKSTIHGTHQVAPAPGERPIFVRRIARPNPTARLPQKAAGVYRIIHGKVAVALDPSTYTLPDGSIDESKPKMEYAVPGEELALNAADATRLFAADMLEELNANPSRVGKVRKTPKQSGPAVGDTGTVLEYPAPVAG